MSENQKNYFFWNKQAFENAVKEIVCVHCDYHGFECENPDPRGCAIFRYLPELVRVAQRMGNPNLEEYRKAVEKEVPFHCEHLGSLQACKLLDSPACGIDKLLPYVLEAVLNTNQTLEARHK